jgi:hypothetical protein
MAPEEPVGSLVKFIARAAALQNMSAFAAPIAVLAAA